MFSILGLIDSSIYKWRNIYDENNINKDRKWTNMTDFPNKKMSITKANETFRKNKAMLMSMTGFKQKQYLHIGKINIK